MSALGTTGAVAARELLATLRTPLAWLVGAGFLALEGTTFAATARLLADPTRPGDYGAVLRGQFAGSLLGWLVLFAVVAAVTARLVAEERRTGTWEALLTAPVSEPAVVLGKWLGAWGFLLLLWLPTLAYPAIVLAFAPPGASLELGALAAAYLGVALVTAAAAAIGLAASALTRSQVVASVLGFAVLVGWLVLGELDDVAGLGGLDALDLRRRMDDLARGAIDLGAVALFAAVTAAALAVAHAGAALGRPGVGGRRRVAIAALVALDGGLVAALVARHEVRFDWTSADVNRLDDATAALLAELDAPLVITVVRPALPEFAPVYAEVDRLLDRLAAAGPIARADLDAARQPAEVAALADRFGAAPRDLVDGGAVVLELGGRRRLIELLDLARFGPDALAVGAIEALAAEPAITTALAELHHVAPPRVCFTGGHGELDAGALARLRAALAADAMAVVDLAGASPPPDCRVVVVAGPETALPAAAALALERHRAAGGGLLVLVRGAGPTGLELILAGTGLVVREAVVVDPAAAVELPGAFAVIDGYADHPVTRPFQERRATVWQAPREVAPAAGAAGATILVAAQGRGVVAVARPASGGRVAAIGGASALAAPLADGVPANVELVRRLIVWLAGADPIAPPPEHAPEHLRLLMTAGELRAVTIAAVAGLPALLLVIGALVARRRRRG